MKDAINAPFFWIALSVLVYEIGLQVNRRFRHPLANPLLIATALLCALLVGTHTAVATYNTGGMYISLCLSPATVSLAVPIFRELDTLRRHLLPILLGALVGSVVSIGSVFALSRLVGLDRQMIVSLLPKSVTTPIGVAVSASLGGIPAVTAIVIIITGLFGAIVLPSFLKKLGIVHPVTTGLAIGTAAHAVGTSRAIELGKTEGAISGLAIGVSGFITALLASVLSIFL